MTLDEKALQTNRWTDNTVSRVAFATEKLTRKVSKLTKKTDQICPLIEQKLTKTDF